MANIITNIFSIKELRDRILFTLFVLAIFRIGAQISVPGINPFALFKVFGTQAQTGFLGMLNLFSGGALGKFSLFALGIMPYISAQIIMQLLKVVVPTLDKLSKEGSYGQKKIELYSKYGTLFLCIVQSVGLLVYLEKAVLLSKHKFAPFVLGPENWTQDGGFSWVFIFTFYLTMTTGTMFLLWLGERITEKGLGNGVSLLIFAGIIARLPQSIFQLYEKALKTPGSVIMLLVVLILFAIIIYLVVAEQQATRKIPVQYAKRVVGNRMYGAQSTHIPFKINPSGVIPIIFAASVIIFPSQILGFLGSDPNSTWAILKVVADAITPPEPAYIVLYMLLVIFFAYFYTAIYFNPVEIADRLKKEGGFIPGIRPGSNTSAYLSKVLNRITLPGSIFLGMIAVFPDIIMIYIPILQSVPAFAYLMGGTSLLILVGVGLDIAKHVESHLLTRNIGGFMKRGKLRGRR